MRWPWMRDDDETRVADEALEQAERRLSEAVDRWSEVRRVSDETRRHLDRNHFAEAIAAIMRGARP